jgi:hypothetical protein
MRQANAGFKPPKILDEVINDKATVVKNQVEGLSNMLVGGSLATSLKALGKNKAKLAKRLNINEDDLDGIIENSARGDISGAINSTSQTAINAVNKTLQNTIGKASQAIKEGGKSIANSLRNPQQTARETYENLDPEEFLGLSEKDLRAFSAGRIPERFQQQAPTAKFIEGGGPAEEEEGDLEGAEYAQSLRESVSKTLQTSKEDLNPFSSPTTLSQEAQGASEAGLNEAKSTAENVVKSAGKEVGESTGAEIVEGLDTVAEASAGADFDPLNLAITASLGLAGLVGGLFIHTHHTENRASPPIRPVNYGSQLF